MRTFASNGSGVTRAVLACLTSFTLPIAAHACATCGCSVSTDAAMGYSAMPGWRLSLDYSFIPQNQLRNGTGAVSPLQAAAVNAAGGSQEVEHQTINRYVNLGISYSPNSKWNFSAIVPYIDRSHTTYGNAAPDQVTPVNLSGATSSGLGDVKVIGSYQGWLPTHNLGIQLGIKLPTGRYGGQNVLTGATVGRNPVFFSTGTGGVRGVRQRSDVYRVCSRRAIGPSGAESRTSYARRAQHRGRGSAWVCGRTDVLGDLV